MRLPALQVAAALALALGAGAVRAQGEKKHEEGKTPPAHKAEPAPHAGKHHRERSNADKAHTDRASAERERREQAARKRLEEKQKATETARQRKEAGAETKKVHLSAQQRDGVHQALLQEKSLHRAGNVRVKPAVGRELPRDIRLYVLPVAILAIVPEYRNYRYIVIGDEFCIVEPRTYEIVDIVATVGQTAVLARSAPAAPVLTLSDEEQMIVLDSVNASSDSTLGLGLLSIGADVPRSIELHNFPDAVLDRVTKLKGYKYFSAEGRVAVVDPKQPRVVMVLGPRR